MIYVICVVLSMVTGTLTDGQSGTRLLSPKIINHLTEEIIVNEGDEIKIICKGDSKLRWKYPSEFQKPALIKDESDNDEFFSELKKSHANGSDIGYYECLNEKNSNASVYVFVNGTGVLLLPLSYAINAIQYQRVIIPCRPTQTDVVVRFVHNREEIRLNTNQWRFDNKIGFIHESGNFKLNGVYDCCANAPGFEEDCEYVNLEVLKHIDNAPIPHLSSNEIVVNAGDNVTLTCSVDTEETVKFHTTWIFPNKTKSVWGKYTFKNKTVYSKQGLVRYHEEILTLSIKNVSKEDEGDLVCLVRDHMNNVNNQSARVKILEHGQTVLKVKEGTVKNISVSVHDNPKWAIDYYAYPVPHFEWYGPHNNKIDNSSKFVIVQTSQKIKLEIINVDLNDTGTYYLQLDNGVKEVLQLNLTVSNQTQ